MTTCVWSRRRRGRRLIDDVGDASSTTWMWGASLGIVDVADVVIVDVGEVAVIVDVG